MITKSVYWYLWIYSLALTFKENSGTNAGRRGLDIDLNEIPDVPYDEGIDMNSLLPSTNEMPDIPPYDISGLAKASDGSDYEDVDINSLVQNLNEKSDVPCDQVTNTNTLPESSWTHQLGECVTLSEIELSIRRAKEFQHYIRQRDLWPSVSIALDQQQFEDVCLAEFKIAGVYIGANCTAIHHPPDLRKNIYRFFSTITHHYHSLAFAEMLECDCKYTENVERTSKDLKPIGSIKSNPDHFFLLFVSGVAKFKLVQPKADTPRLELVNKNS